MRRSKVFLAISIFHGIICNTFEILIRMDFPYRYHLYYLLPIPVHALPWLVSIVFLIYLLIRVKPLKPEKVFAILLNGLFVCLFLLSNTAYRLKLRLCADSKGLFAKSRGTGMPVPYAPAGAE